MEALLGVAVQEALQAFRNRRRGGHPAERAEPPDNAPAAQATWLRPGTFLQGLPTYFRTLVLRRAPRAPPHVGETLSPTEILETYENLQRTMGQSRSDSTWDNISSVLNQFNRFGLNQSTPAYVYLPLDQRMAFWVEWKIGRGHLHRTSPTVYAKKLAQAYALVTGTDSVFLRTYIKGLNRRIGCGPDGATPMPVTEFHRLMAAVRDRHLYVHLLLQWLTASRADDMLRLRRMDFTFDVPTNQVRVTWATGTKGSNLPHVDIVELTPDQMRHVYAEVCAVEPYEKAFMCDAEAITRIVRQILEGDTYSSHSIKKGALVFLISKGHTLVSVAYKAKHQSLRLLKTYVGPLPWALAHGAREMARDLLLGQ
jgi:integrase